MIENGVEPPYSIPDLSRTFVDSDTISRNKDSCDRLLPVTLAVSLAACYYAVFDNDRGRKPDCLSTCSRAGVAQLVEQPPCKRQVRGSIPFTGSTL